MLATEYRRDLAITVGIVLLLSGVLVAIYGPSNISLRLDSLLVAAFAYAWFAAGPFTGWMLVALGGFIFSALWGLVPLTFFSIWPAVRAAKATTSASRRLMLALAGLVWLFSGFFYTVAMWI